MPHAADVVFDAVIASLTASVRGRHAFGGQELGDSRCWHGLEQLANSANHDHFRMVVRHRQPHHVMTGHAHPFESL